MKTSQFSKLIPVFQFASISFPRYLAALPKGSFKKRISDAKNRVCGQYQLQPSPITGRKELATSFYLESDFQPGLRWQWADEVSGVSIRHKGWFCDDFQDQTIRGLVFRLPQGRGFLAGWSMGKEMASTVEYDCTYDTERDAALAADSLAENAAKREREYQAAQDQDQEETE